MTRARRIGRVIVAVRGAACRAWPGAAFGGAVRIRRLAGAGDRRAMQMSPSMGRNGRSAGAQLVHGESS